MLNKYVDLENPVSVVLHSKYVKDKRWDIIVRAFEVFFDAYEKDPNKDKYHYIQFVALRQLPSNVQDENERKQIPLEI